MLVFTGDAEGYFTAYDADNGKALWSFQCGSGHHASPVKCPYCSSPLELARHRRELDAATWRRVPDEAAALVVQVHFSGGEPLVRRDLADLIRHALELDLHSNLSTGPLWSTPQCSSV